MKKIYWGIMDRRQKLPHLLYDKGRDAIVACNRLNHVTAGTSKMWGSDINFKWHVCEAGEPLNPILRASGGEIQVEQFGIIGWLDKVKAHKDCNVRIAGKTYKGKKLTHYMQCSLIEARETGTGKFGEWLESVKKFCREEHGTVLALATITNGHLYKYCQRHAVFVAQERMLYTVKNK